LGLRIGGVTLFAMGWSAAIRLDGLALTTPARDATSFMMLLAAAIFLCGSAGSALLFVGPGLWETVEVAERWRGLPDRVGETCNRQRRTSQGSDPGRGQTGGHSVSRGSFAIKPSHSE
jgi:hypothetical protein